MRSHPMLVNRGSRIAARLRQQVTLGWVLAALLSAGTARADRVVVLRATGDAPTLELERIEDAVVEAVRQLHHEALTESAAGFDMAADALPETANEMRAIAELQRAQWVVVPIVHDHGQRAYYLTLRVGYAAQTRVEELDAEVRRAHENRRLEEILRAMLRPEGLGDEALSLAGEDAEGRQVEAEAEEEARRQAEEEARRQAEEEARRQAEEEARRQAAEREAAERARREQEAFEHRDRYGTADGLNLVQLGLALRPLLLSGGDGGVLGTFALRIGRGFEGLDGFELRGGIDFTFGAAAGLSIFGGAAYLFSPWTTPLHLGASVELGLFRATTGNRRAAFMGRVSAVLAYNLAGGFYVEASLPELMYLSSGGGALSMGVAGRAGVRF